MDDDNINRPACALLGVEVPADREYVRDVVIDTRTGAYAFGCTKASAASGRPNTFRLGSKLTIDGVPTWIAHPHCKGFGWDIPLVNGGDCALQPRQSVLAASWYDDT